MNRNKSISATAFITALALSGCGGEPSSSDIDKAARQLYSSLPIGGIKVHEVKKIVCAAAQGAPGYTCDVEVDAASGLTGRRKDVTRLRFVKASDGWKVSQ